MYAVYVHYVLPLGHSFQGVHHQLTLTVHHLDVGTMTTTRLTEMPPQVAQHSAPQGGTLDMVRHPLEEGRRQAWEMELGITTEGGQPRMTATRAHLPLVLHPPRHETLPMDPPQEEGGIAMGAAREWEDATPTALVLEVG